MELVEVTRKQLYLGHATILMTVAIDRIMKKLSDKINNETKLTEEEIVSGSSYKL